jgi:hypothetical protein
MRCLANEIFFPFEKANTILNAVIENLAAPKKKTPEKMKTSPKISLPWRRRGEEGGTLAASSACLTCRGRQDGLARRIAVVFSAVGNEGRF